MKVAYTGWTWLIHHSDNKTHDLEQAIKECKYLGYDVVENFAFIADFYPDPSELKALLDKYDVWLANLYGHYSGDVEADYAKGKAQLDFMSHVGAKFYNTQGSCWKEEPFERPLDEETVLKYADMSNRLGEYANSLGIKLCFHPHANSAVFSEEQIDFFCANTDPALVNLCLDTAHTTIAHMDAPTAFRKYVSRIAYVHLKDVDLHVIDGPHNAMRSFRALGLGQVDFAGVIKELRAGGYDGVLCVELDNPEICNYNSAEISRKYLRNALKL